MKNGQLAVSRGLGLLKIENIVSDFCVYCRILTGEMSGGLTCEYKSTITPIEGTEGVDIYIKNIC